MSSIPNPLAPLPPMPSSGGFDGQQLHVILLIVVALLALLVAINWLTLWRVARLERLQKELSQAQMGLAQAVLASRAGEGDPHAALCRIVSSVVGQQVKDLMPLRGSVAPTYLLFREDAPGGACCWPPPVTSKPLCGQKASDRATCPGSDTRSGPSI